jgi:hypothetical protein
MTATTNLHLSQIHALLAEKGYEVTEPAPDTLNIRETGSGISVHGVLQGDILFLSLVCTVVPRSAVTPDLMTKMLAGDNGISTSAFRLYEAGAGKVAITLNNFCKLLNMDAEDEDDIISCVHFLLVDVLAARSVLSGLQS